jgi:phosphonate transport system permease protein
VNQLINRLQFSNTNLLFLMSAVRCLLIADIAITTLNPWAELRRLLAGIVRPDIWSVEALSVVYRVAFAVLGVGLGASVGFLLALEIVRSTPGYMLAYVLLQTFGPSMLPAIIALSVHNAGIIGYLIGRLADTLEYRSDAPKAVNL